MIRLNKEHYGELFETMLKQTYKSFLLTLGEFDTENDTNFEQFVFLFAVIFSTVVMLNLVIALMSDAYEQVMSSVEEQDLSDTNSMIIDAECLFKWNRSKESSDKENTSGEKGTYIYFVE